MKHEHQINQLTNCHRSEECRKLPSGVRGSPKTDFGEMKFELELERCI